MTDKTDKLDMSKLLKQKAEMPESMKEAIRKMEEADALGDKIKTTMKNKISDSMEYDRKKDFLKKYADKMKAPKGMDLMDIPNDTPRIDMKVPKELRKGALSKVLSKVGRAAGPASVLASVLDQEELNPVTPAEDPNLTDEERMEYNVPRDEDAEYLNELEAKKRERYEKIKERLAQSE